MTCAKFFKTDILKKTCETKQKAKRNENKGMEIVFFLTVGHFKIFFPRQRFTILDLGADNVLWVVNHSRG